MHTQQEKMELYDQHEKYIYSTIKRRFGSDDFLEQHGITRDDLIQHGRLGLSKACDEYSSDKGSSFKSFAISNIYWTIIGECKKESLSRDTGWTFKTIDRVSLDSKPPVATEEENSMYDIVKNEDIAIPLDEDLLLNCLSESLPEWLVKVTVLKAKGYTNKEIGKQIGITHQAVSAGIRRNRDKIKTAISMYAQNTNSVN